MEEPGGGFVGYDIYEFWDSEEMFPVVFDVGEGGFGTVHAYEFFAGRRWVAADEIVGVVGRVGLAFQLADFLEDRGF